MKYRVTLLIAALGLALPQFTCAENHYYLVDTIATQSSQPQSRAEARELEKIYSDIEKQSGVDAKLVYSTNPDINAFATEIGKDKIIVVQEGLLTSMHGDRDAVAAVLGHELGHHKADHIRAGRRKQQSVLVLGSILGAVVGAKVGQHNGNLAGAATGAAVGVGASLVALKFNRDQEMEADRLSLGWMITAGYNPQGMLRLQRHLGELEGRNKHAAIFSTHPSSAKRYQAAERQIAKLDPPADLLAHPVEPLVGSEALATAAAEIKSVEDAQLAEVLKPQGDPVSAEALAPVDKMGFDAYAALENKLLFAGDKGKPQLLAKNHLTEAQLTHMTEAFTERMKQNPALAQRYSAEFFRASQGKLASYGRDLADSYEHGQPLKLEPPYPLDTARLLFSEMQKRGAPSLSAKQQAAAEAEVLKSHDLTYYDFLIGHNWWSRKANIAALSGDTSILRQYYGMPTDDDEDDTQSKAKAAGVHVGSNVHMGENVRVGTKALTNEKSAEKQDGK